MIDEEALLAANAAYYQAFQLADFKAMSAIWHDGEVTCVHPGWRLIEGRGAVLESYRLIFLNPRQEAVVCQDERVIVTGDMARVLCVETVGGGALAATNLFIRDGGAWRLVHHQASPIAARVAEPRPRRLN